MVCLWKWQPDKTWGGEWGPRKGAGEGAGGKGRCKWILKFLCARPTSVITAGGEYRGARGKFWIWDRVLWNSRMFLPAPVCLFPAHLPSLHHVVVMACSSDLSHLASRGTHWVKILNLSRMMLNVLNHNSTIRKKGPRFPFFCFPQKLSPWLLYFWNIIPPRAMLFQLYSRFFFL